jgi:hypothetical protein
MHIACRGSGPAETKTLVTVDLATNMVVNSLEMPQPDGNDTQRPFQTQYNDDETVLYVLSSDGWLHLVDTATLTINESIDTGAYSSYGFVLDNDIDRIAIVSPDEHIDGVTVVDFGGDDCPWDMDGSGFVDLPDLTAALANWGACADPMNCPWDMDGSGYVDLPDLTAMLSNWGPCP